MRHTGYASARSSQMNESRLEGWFQNTDIGLVAKLMRSDWLKEKEAYMRPERAKRRICPEA